MLKKALLWDENRNQFELRTGFLQFYVKTKKVCRCFASFSSEQEHFTHAMYMTALIRPSDVKKIKPIMFYEGINAKVFRRSIAFAIAVVVTSRSSSFKYTISAHAVHAGGLRNVCNIVVSTETPPNFHESTSNAAPRVQTSTLTPAPPQVLTSKTPTTLSSAFCADALQMYQVSSTGPNILVVYIIYLHV